MKSYTDLEQSKVLSQILPLESADMLYYCDKSNNIQISQYPFIRSFKEKDTFSYLHCWSLSALLDILAEQDFIVKSLERNNEYQYNIDIPSRHCKIWFSSLLDAAFEMICWLKKEEYI